MPVLQTPQQQAGVLSFYDAPEKGPSISFKAFLVVSFIVVLAILIIDGILLRL